MRMRLSTAAFLPLLAATTPAAGAGGPQGGGEQAERGHIAAQEEAPLRIAYHVADDVNQAARMAANIRNQLRLDPEVEIAVVAIGPGIDFLIEGEEDANGNPFDATVEDLTAQGVKFLICGTTMTSRGIEPDEILPEARIVTSGMNEIARLQLREGYAYIRP